MDGESRCLWMHRMPYAPWRPRAYDRPSYYGFRSPSGAPVHYPAVPVAPPRVRETWDDKQQDGRTLRTVFGEITEGF
jgi:hypothetical protein